MADTVLKVVGEKRPGLAKRTKSSSVMMTLGSILTVME
jgi:hypothetical protein